MNAATTQIQDEDFRTQWMDYGLRFDPVTGLPNQTCFRNSMRSMLADASARGRGVALVWIDLLNLRREYSVGGVEGAERLVCMLADSLRPWVEDGELICRASDRCFLLLLKKEECLEARLRVILDSASPLHSRGSEGKPEVAAGVAFFPDHAASAEELSRLASLAAISAARTRSRTAVEFHPGMNTELLNERALERDLRVALRENQLSLVYQPQIDLMTGDVVGVEALTRWQHPTLGAISPAQFIPVAERSDLIQELFTHSLRRMLADAAAWRGAGVVLPSIAINASAANVRYAEFVETVKRELEANPLSGTELEMEVTESLLMDDEALFLERLKALREIGVKISLDDFGTRYTGFNALKGLPLHAMKIDQCFVHGLDRSSQAQSICRTIVTMARHLRLSTVAEGVEDAGELRILQRIGCRTGQGYLFQRPVPSDEFLRFLEEWPRRRRQPEFAEAFLDVGIYMEHENPDYESPGYEIDPLFGVA